MAAAVPEALVKKQLRQFGLTDNTRLTSVKSVEKLMKNVGIALRYWRTEKLPLASLYQAACGNPKAPPKEKFSPGVSQREEAQRIAIELTNHLLASHQGIEVNVIAGRIALVHRDLVPSLYVLVRNHGTTDDLSGVSPLAKKVFHFITETRETTAGLVRKFLGMPVVDLNNDPAYLALAELQSNFLIDRGPYQIRKTGIPYLSKEGYPYHCFHLAHPELVKSAAKLSRSDAAQNFLLAYLRGAVFATDMKMCSMFSAFLSRKEVNDAIETLADHKKISINIVKKDRLIISR